MGSYWGETARRFAAWHLKACLLWLLINIDNVSCSNPLPQPRRFTYPGEHVLWENCGNLTGRPLECGEISVPMDQFDAKNSGNKTFTIPLIRLRGNNATKSVLLNPGGPGGSGTSFMHLYGKETQEIIGDGFHLLSFDPRGINGSRPQALCYPDNETRQRSSEVRNSLLVEDSAELWAWSRNFARACLDTTGEHGKYINTPQTAADMNSILQAIGQDNLYYWGFSYGTLLGQTYATLFPNRSERVIIDGVANQFDWYESLLDKEPLIDTDKVLYGFFEECLKVGENCSLSSLADSADGLWDTFLNFTQILKEQPINVYINNTSHGLLDFPTLWFQGLFPGLYKPEVWYTLADNLAKLLKGNATDAFLAYGKTGPFKTDNHLDALHFVMLNDGYSGAAYWPSDRQSLLDKILPLLRESLFGPTMNRYYYARQQWAVPRTHTYVPRKGVKTMHPLLILSTTYDPVCPLVSAKSANEAFQDSRIVEVKGYGHCSIAVPSMCIARHIRDFFYEGKLPKENTQCEVDGPYFGKPEEDGKVVPLVHFENPEERRIHLSQAHLAKRWDIPLPFRDSYI